MKFLLWAGWLVMGSSVMLCGQELDAFRVSTPKSAVNEARSWEEQIADLRVWADKSGLRQLAVLASQAEAKFAGVKATGEAVLTQPPGSVIDVDAVFFKNSNYWRGVVEMHPGNHLVAAMPVFAWAANGDLSKAYRLMRILRIGRDDTITGKLLAELDERLTLVREGEAQRIEAGIKLHDAGKYDEAIGAYEKVIEVMPSSAWANYESLLSKMMRDKLGKLSQDLLGDWRKASGCVYVADPLYAMQLTGSRGIDMAALMDRMHLQALAKTSNSDVGTYVGTYGDLALRLEAYVFAAHLYWLGMGAELRGIGPDGDKPEKISIDERITRFLYCLEQLGVRDLKANFKGDFTKKFKALDKKLKKHRQS